MRGEGDEGTRRRGDGWRWGGGDKRRQEGMRGQGDEGMRGA